MKFEDLWKYKLLLEIDRNNYKNVKENLENIILRKYGKNKLPCKTCKKMREYEIYETTSSINMYKKQINHISFECRCKKCNTKLYPEELLLANDRIRINEEAKYFEMTRNTITRDMLNEILLKYSISIKSLSKILNMPHLKTYFRFGLITKKDSDTLLKVYNDVEYYIELLKLNKNKIDTNEYISSLEASTALLESMHLTLKHKI